MSLLRRLLLAALVLGAVAVGCDRHEPEQKLGLHFPVPGHFPGAPWGVQGASGQQTFTGAAVGGFSASKYLANTTPRAPLLVGSSRARRRGSRPQARQRMASVIPSAIIAPPSRRRARRALRGAPTSSARLVRA